MEAARELPGYRDAFAAAGPIDPADPIATLGRLPLLEREQVQERPGDFRAAAAGALQLSSSGSTGTPLTLWLDPRSRRRRRRQLAGFFHRSGWRPWHSALSFKVLPDDSARMGSALLDRSLLRRRATVPVAGSQEDRFAALRDRDPQILQGLPSILEELAMRAEAESWRPRHLRRVFSCSEALSPAARIAIERGLGAPVVDHYGSAEALIGFECEYRSGIHVLERNVFVEILGEGGHECAPGEVGRVVLTTLDNPAMPLIRYAIGDMAIAPSGEPCRCGRPGPVLPRVLGRQVPLFEVGGRRVSPWGAIARMHELESVRQFQLVQDFPGTVVVIVRHRPGHPPIDREAVARLVASELGDAVRIEVREAGMIPALATGKQAPALVDAGGPR